MPNSENNFLSRRRRDASTPSISDAVAFVWESSEYKKARWVELSWVELRWLVQWEVVGAILVICQLPKWAQCAQFSFNYQLSIYSQTPCPPSCLIISSNCILWKARFHKFVCDLIANECVRVTICVIDSFLFFLSFFHCLFGFPFLSALPSVSILITNVFHSFIFDEKNEGERENDDGGGGGDVKSWSAHSQPLFWLPRFARATKYRGKWLSEMWSLETQLLWLSLFLDVNKILVWTKKSKFNKFKRGKQESIWKNSAQLANKQRNKQRN